MPNDCTNYITITCKDEEVLNKLVRNELQYFDGDNYLYKVRMIKRGYRGIFFSMRSAWNPHYKWLESLIEKYADCWVKDEWQEEDGLAGNWIGYFDKDKKVITQCSWRDLSTEEIHYLFLEKNPDKNNIKSLEEDLNNQTHDSIKGNKDDYDYDNEHGNTINVV